MGDDPASIIRDAKTLVRTLKETLNTREPWDQEVELTRRKLQKLYLLLLLVHPFAKESKDAETSLWMQTSYVLIKPYKTRIAAIEAALHKAGTQKPQGKRQQQHGPVELRKIVHHYRQFLAGEEKFWMRLIARLHQQFALHDADAALKSLAISSADEAGPQPSHFQFPLQPQDFVPSSDAAERAATTSLLAKALVCLGDLARYRELASDSGARRQDDQAKRGGRGGRGGKHSSMPSEASPKTLDRARALYEAARSVAPDDGNAPHQLAILALHKQDLFEVAVQNYRALCVQAPYETAAGNLSSVLSRAVKKYKEKASQGKDATPKPTLWTFKESVVVLHGAWMTGGDGDLAQNLVGSITGDFASLIADRALPVDTLTKVLTLAQGALWRVARDQGKDKVYDQSASSLVLTYLLSLYRVLFDIGTKELHESQKIDASELAMRITAVLRRMLPALRIAGKWLRVQHNLDIVSSSAMAQPLWASYSAFSSALASVFPPYQLPPLRRSLEEDIELSGYTPLGGLLVLRPASAAATPHGDPAPEEVHPNVEQLMRVQDIWHDATLVSELVPSRMRSFRASTAPSQAPAPRSLASPPTASTSQPTFEQPLVPQSMAMQEDDARTETTDPVDDAFRQALDAEDDTDEEEILWNPRASTGAMPVPSGFPASFAQVKEQSPPAAASLAPGPPAPFVSTISPPRLGPAAQVSPPRAPTQASARHAPLSAPTSAMPHTPKTTAQDLLANVLSLGTPSGQPRRMSQVSPMVPSHLSMHAVADPKLPSLPSAGGLAAVPGTGTSIWAASPNENARAMHARRVSQSSAHGPADPRGSSQPPPWAGIPERLVGQHQMLDAAPQAQPPPHSYPVPIQAPVFHPGQGASDYAHPVGAHAHRRMPSAGMSALLEHHHSYMPPPSAQPQAYASSVPQRFAPPASTLPQMMSNMGLNGAHALPPSGARRDELPSGYGVSPGMQLGGAPYASGLSHTGLGLASGIWGPAG